MISTNLIEQAVQNLYEAVRRQVLAEVTEALGGPWESAPRAKAARALKNGSSSSALRKGEKRDPKLLAQTVEDLFQQIEKAPGSRIEQIGAHLGLPTKDLALPVRKLLAAKRIKSTGVKRATRYFPR